MEPLNPEEVRKINELITTMTLEQKDALLAKIPQGQTVLNPYIRSLINTN